jgi:hypothetical protein
MWIEIVRPPAPTNFNQPLFECTRGSCEPRWIIKPFFRCLLAATCSNLRHSSWDLAVINSWINMIPRTCRAVHTRCARLNSDTFTILFHQWSVTHHRALSHARAINEVCTLHRSGAASACRGPSGISIDNCRSPAFSNLQVAEQARSSSPSSSGTQDTERT